MKTNYTILFSALALGTTALLAPAQDENKDRPPRPVPPLMAALDANKDGEIDASEIANAPAALKTLDKNGDGKLSGDEIRPPRGPGGPGGPGGDRRGPGARPPGPKKDGA